MIRNARYKRMVEKGLIDPKTSLLSPRFNNELSWEDNPKKDWYAAAMAVHTAMVDRPKDITWKLYDLSKDATEINDLSAQQQGKVSELNAKWYQWANTHNVFPKPAR